MWPFSSDSFDPKRDIPSLDGKVIMVTGGNAGIGASFVKALAAHNPSCIYLCARTQSSAQKVVETVHQLHPKANIQILSLDLNSFDSVRACAAQFNSQSDRLDLLFLNAGVSATLPKLTTEGYESQFGINHMGHALLCQLLMPKLLQTRKSDPTSDVRIMLTSSVAAHRMSPATGLDLSKMKTPADSLSPMGRYGHSKLANTLFAKKLAEAYPDIISTSHHPGTVKTEIWGKADDAKLLVWLVSPIVWATGIDCDKGAETGLWCAAVDKEKIENGRYYEPVGNLKDNKKVADQKLANELWEWTNKELESHGAPGWPAV